MNSIKKPNALIYWVQDKERWQLPIEVAEKTPANNTQYMKDTKIAGKIEKKEDLGELKT